MDLREGCATMTFEVEMSYARMTTQDRNPLKRFVQRRRLAHGLRAVRSWDPADGMLLDVGSGGGEFSVMLAQRFPRARIVCHEPAEVLHKQARARLRGVPRVELVAQLAALPDASFCGIFCLEVFEHLPDSEMAVLLDEVQRLLAPAGRFVIGVPNEIHLAAAVRGLFRVLRRGHAFDVAPRNILAAVRGQPPAGRRPVDEITAGSRYYKRHMGFDHRVLLSTLDRRFRRVESYGSPAPWLSLFFNLEVYAVYAPGGTA